MPDTLAQLREELAIANQILAHENVVDAFGHISMRHPEHPDRYLISSYRAAERVTAATIVELSLDSKHIHPFEGRMYSELVIHGEVYKARPDINSVCHHHAISVMPFCIAGIDLVPVMHLGATMGETVPFWDSRDEFGDTRLLVTKPEEGASMARALGPHWTVLLRRHGATVGGRSLRECVFRSIYGCRNAELQSQSMAMGRLDRQARLSRGEIEMCAEGSLNERTLWRAWDYWSGRLPERATGTRLAGNVARSASTKKSRSAKSATGRARTTKVAGKPARKGRSVSKTSGARRPATGRKRR